MTRQSITDLESTVAQLRSDYDARFAAIAQSATETQAKFDAAVAAAVKAKEDEDDTAFSQVTTELKDILSSHTAIVAANAAPPDPTPVPVADPTQGLGTDGPTAGATGDDSATDKAAIQADPSTQG